MDRLKIVSLNVRGLRGRKRYKIYRWLNDNNFDVCLLQESYCTESFVSVMNKGWNGKIFHSYSASEHSKGVCILFRQGLELDIITESFVNSYHLSSVVHNTTCANLSSSDNLRARISVPSM